VRIVVTGGAGFIGANLCRVLGEDPAITRVVALDDLSTGHRENLDGACAELVEGSILDGDLVEKLLSGADAVVHLAARPSVPRSLTDPVATHDVNVNGTVNVLEAARRAGVHVVNASSSSVYGGNLELPKHEGLATRPLSPYAASKLAAESYSLSYAQSFGLPVLSFRFFNVYGPLQAAGHAYAAVVPAFLDAALNGRPLVVHGDGRQTRDFTYVGTVVETLRKAVTRQVTSAEPVNLAFGTRSSLLELIEALRQVLGLDVGVVHVEPRTGDVRDSQASARLLHGLFPDVVPVPLEQGLQETADWFRGGAGA
jgi:UDP-glucose 4-epimerase